MFAQVDVSPRVAFSRGKVTICEGWVLFSDCKLKYFGILSGISLVFVWWGKLEYFATWNFCYFYYFFLPDAANFFYDDEIAHV